MLKKSIIGVLVVTFLLTSVGITQAQFGFLPKAGLTPDSPFYFLDKWGESMSMAFSFSSEAKAEKALKFSEERLSELKVMSEKNKTKQVTKLAENYRESLKSAQDKSKEIKSEKKSEVEARVASSTSKHLSVLEEVLNKVPEEAKEAIRKAKENSKKGHMQALESLSKSKPDEAAKIGANALKQRLEEIKQATATKQFQNVESLAKDFEDLSKGFREMAQNNNRVKVQEMVGSSTAHHIEVLEGVYEKVPQQAKESIRKAIEESRKGRENALDALKNASEQGKENAREALDKIESLEPDRPGKGKPTTSESEESTNQPEEGPDLPEETPGQQSGNQSNQEANEQSGPMNEQSQETPGSGSPEM